MATFTLLFTLLLFGAVAAGFGEVLLYLDRMFCDFSAKMFLAAELPESVAYLLPLCIRFSSFGQLLTFCKQLPNFCLQILLVGFELCQRINAISG